METPMGCMIRTKRIIMIKVSCTSVQSPETTPPHIPSLHPYYTQGYDIAIHSVQLRFHPFVINPKRHHMHDPTQSTYKKTLPPRWNIISYHAFLHHIIHSPFSPHFHYILTTLSYQHRLGIVLLPSISRIELRCPLSTSCLIFYPRIL